MNVLFVGCGRDWDFANVVDDFCVDVDGGFVFFLLVNVGRAFESMFISLCVAESLVIVEQASEECLTMYPCFVLSWRLLPFSVVSLLELIACVHLIHRLGDFDTSRPFDVYLV